ncbi:Hypothetical protein Eab7_0341 [Exiguobacterium antarcticum B7]|nr:Hypothetical protein Eab7_0341 [Exiguobacterium antarcticum B7]
MHDDRLLVQYTEKVHPGDARMDDWNFLFFILFLTEWPPDTWSKRNCNRWNQKW